MNNLGNAQNSIDEQWDYLGKGSLGTCSRVEWIMIYHRLEYYLWVMLFITPSIIYTLLFSG